MGRIIRLLGVLALITSTLAGTASPAGAAVNDWEIYAPWGVTSLATDRQTLNNIYVYDIENINGVVYVGGAFQQVVHRDSPDRPIDQAFLAAFDAESGDIVGTFRPQIDHPVYAIIEHPTTGAVLVGGEFTQVNGQPQEGLVALNPVTGATDSSYDVDIKLGGSWRATVRGLDTDGSSIYIGGGFDRVVGSNGSFTRGELAKTNLTGAIDPSWDPTVSGGGVWTIALTTDQNRLIAGGRFDRVDGVSRPGIAMVQATGTGALTNTFQVWNRVGSVCYAGYPGCLFIYDIDVADGKVLISGAEHFTSLHDDTTGNRIKLWRETNDTQAGLIHNGLAWTVRHGIDRGIGLYYAYDLNTFERVVTTANRLSSGAGGFAYESAGSCIWFGGAVGGMDLANVAGTNKVRAFNIGFMCPPGTTVKPSVLNINNWQDGNPPPAGDLTCDLTVDGTTVTIEWEGNTNADAVIVFRTPAGANTSWRGRVNQPGTTFTDTLRTGVTYNYEIRERTGNTNGDAINCGDATAGNPPPPPAGDLTCDLTVDGTTVTIEWEGNTNADAVIVFRTPAGANTSWRGRVNQPGTTFTDTLRTGVTYNYEIRERTGNTNGDAINCGDATAGNPPPPPAGDLTCDLTVDGTTVTIEWEGNTNADAVIVFRTPAGANTSWRGRVNQPGTTFTDTLRTGVTYNYEIRERTGNTNGDAINCGDV